MVKSQLCRWTVRSHIYNLIDCTGKIFHIISPLINYRHADKILVMVVQRLKNWCRKWSQYINRWKYRCTHTNRWTLSNAIISLLRNRQIILRLWWTGCTPPHTKKPLLWPRVSCYGAVPQKLCRTPTLLPCMTLESPRFKMTGKAYHKGIILADRDPLLWWGSSKKLVPLAPGSLSLPVWKNKEST